MAAPRLFVCVLVASLQVAAPGLAQPAPRTNAPTTAPTAPIVRRPVAIVNLDLTGNNELVALAIAVSNALETHPILRPRELVAPLYERIDDPDANFLSRAQRRQTEALAEMANGNFEPAARLAKDGQNELLKVTPTQAVLLYSELAFIRGKALVGEGKSVEARESFSLAQRLDPGRRIDPAREPPDVVAAYNAAITASAPTGRIAIENTRGTVWIDGSDKGFAPNHYVITSGPHVVWVTDRDRETNGIEIDVKAGETIPAPVPEQSAPFSVKLQRARQELARAPDDGARIVAMKRIAEISSVKDAVVLSTANGKIFYQAWRSDDADRAPGFSQKHEHEAKDLPVEVLQDLLPPPVDADPPGVVFPIPIDDTRWYQKPSYWAGIAFGTSLVAVGAYFLITSLIPNTFGGLDTDVGIINPEDRITR